MSLSSYIDGRLSLQEAATVCGRSVKTLRRWCREGVVPANKIGRDWFIFESDLLKALEPNNIASQPAESWMDDPSLQLTPRAMSALGLLKVESMVSLAELDLSRLARIKGCGEGTQRQIAGARQYARSVLGLEG